MQGTQLPQWSPRTNPHPSNELQRHLPSYLTLPLPEMIDPFHRRRSACQRIGVVAVGGTKMRGSEICAGLQTAQKHNNQPLNLPVVGGIGAKARWLNWLCGIRARRSSCCVVCRAVRLLKYCRFLTPSILGFLRKASEQKRSTKVWNLLLVLCPCKKTQLFELRPKSLY